MTPHSEVPALLGARQTLETVEVVMTEAPVMNYNQGSPPFTVLTSVLNHLVRRGCGWSFAMGLERTCACGRAQW